MQHEEPEDCPNIPGAKKFRYNPAASDGADTEPTTRRVTVATSVLVVNPFEPDDISDFLALPPPPRQWLLGTVICRTFLTVISASGGTGKSALVICWAIALATKRAIAGFHIHKRARVLVLTFEDTADEYRRRFAAAFMHHGIDPKEAAGYLYVKSLNGIGVTIGSIQNNRTDGGPIVLPTSAPGLIENVISRLDIDVIILDPFIKCAGVPENDNVAIDGIVKILSGICERRNIAGGILHHNRKGSHEPGNMETSRGASSLIDAARIGQTLTPMSREEADMYQVPEEERRRLIRLDDGKLNLSLKADPTWYRLASINIGNGTEEYPNGDNVQACETWTPPDMWRELTPIVVNQIMDDIANGLPDGARYSKAPNAGKRAAWKVVKKHADCLNEKQCRDAIKTWLDTGMLVEVEYYSKVRRESLPGLFVNDAKRPG